MILMLLMMIMVILMMVMMMIRVSYDYDDDTDDDNGHKNDSYTAAGATPGASAAPGAESLRHVPRSLSRSRMASACGKESWQEPNDFCLWEEVLAEAESLRNF